MNQSDPAPACPYCGVPLEWVPYRWFGRGTFVCSQCGDFPDLRGTGPSATPPHALQQPVRVTIPPKVEDRRRVLLVDDSAEHRDLYALMLESTVTVVTASRGEDALTIAAAEPPDAIVLDVMMPHMDGWQVCEHLKANPVTSGIPVIMLTSLDGIGVPARARQLGAAAVLTKPCPIERLALTIDAAIAGRSVHGA
jgi:CheY-like chemotaxis protein